LGGRQGEDGVDGPGVLRRYTRDDGSAVDAERREGLEIGLDAGATPRIAPRDREGGPHGRAMENRGLKSDARLWRERERRIDQSTRAHRDDPDARPERTRPVRQEGAMEEPGPRVPSDVPEVPRGDGAAPGRHGVDRRPDRGEPAGPAERPQAGGVQPGGLDADDLPH